MFLSNIKILTLIILTILNYYTHAEEFTGKVIGISDGDTITILTNNKKTKIRLAEIDTPEKNQPYGKKAKKALSDFIFGKTIQVEIESIDRYGRTVGKILLNGLDINREMVKAGHAWVYVQYVKDKTLFDLEENARENQLGLWALPESQRIAPWEWRRGKRNMKKESNLSFQCETKTTCRQMQSCAEAKYYLVNCGLMRLDGDKDGIPCESLCR
tara:strand:- start:361 stop:1002 length:642 start_codon:yes stop_codon:yes gene_type:complete